MTFHPHIVRAYDIRGTVGINLHEADAQFLGQQFGAYLRLHGKSTVVVGHDGRLSSPSLSQALCQGLMQQGLTVMHVGMVPTPLVYFAVQTCPCDAGIVVTGSHNAAADNGFKITLRERPFYGEDLKQLAFWDATSYDGPRGRTVSIAIDEVYLQHLKNLLPHPLPLRIVWDTGHGVVGKLIRSLSEMACVESHFLYSEVDGHFPAHAPNPSDSKAMAMLKQTVRQGDFDLGVAFDGDGDRLGVVDAKGRLLAGDQLLGILAQEVLQHYPGAPILMDVKASRGVWEHIESLGGEPHLSPSGHSRVKERLKMLGAPLAGELSGHFFFADEYFGFDDAIYSLFRLLRFLGSSCPPLDQWVDLIPQWVSSPEYRIPCAEDDKMPILNTLAHCLAQDGVTVNDLDGLRVELKDSWWLLRPSNTEAVLSLRLEGRTADDLLEALGHYLRYFGAALMERIR